MADLAYLQTLHCAELFARDSYAKCVLAIVAIVRLFVPAFLCLSHCFIASKRSNLKSRNLYCWLPQRF